MACTKPFHRNVRGIKTSPNSGYSGRAYIRDREYARNAEHYVRAYILIQNELQSIFEYVEPSNECLRTYSFRIHALLMRVCIEIEANFKAILLENTFTRSARSMTINDYRKIDVTHHLSSYEVMLPTWNGPPRILKPFEPWLSGRGTNIRSGVGLSWYQAYNASKHDRHDEFRKANFDNLLLAVAGLLIVMTSQFQDETFSAGSDVLGLEDEGFHPMEAALGSLFRIKYPNDWSDDEIYDFDWSVLKDTPDRFARVDFDSIPS